MKKIMLIFGTRPEAIKMAPLILKLKKEPDFKTIVCVTGQHREMLAQVMDIFSIKADYNLNIMKTGQDLYDITSKVLIGLRDILKREKPDIVLVHGDTTTSISAALAAFYQQIPIGHVEAGLRTNDIYSPWPEEINRQMTSRIATLDFCPTQDSRANLLKENIPEKRIVVTGNTVIDALHIVVDKIKSDKALDKKLAQELQNYGYDTNRLSNGKKLVLITGHRRENFGEGFINICESIKTLSEKFPNVDFVYPVHLNPNVREPIFKVFGRNCLDNASGEAKNLYFIEPLEYLSFVFLMEKSYLILTDSGGIQEEAPGLSKPVLVMRNTTERPEAVKAGTVKLVGTDKNKIIEETSRLLTSKGYYNSMSKAINPYGDGKASERIINFIRQSL